MVLGGQGLEPEEAPTKVQVVYYLSRAGQLLQPHLIDVPVSPHSNGLYLRDVKKKMTAIRGKGVADSFSWSCKRNYKDNFIWQDLSDDDKILPLSDGEFVLKGSGLYAGYRAKSDYLSDGQLEPESTSFSPQHAAKFKTLEAKKFDFDAVKRSLDLQTDQHQEQGDLAAALSLSLQMMSNPSSRFSKDKSMDLNQQVMNSLSQAKTGPAEECILDHYEMSSSETFLSEESTGQNHSQNQSQNHSREISRERVKSTSSSSGTELNYDSAREAGSKDVSANHSRDLSKVGNNTVSKGRQEPDELPPIKTKKSTSGELGDSSVPFMLSPRRLMAALSTPTEKKIGRMLHSTSARSSTMSSATSNQSDAEPLSAIKFTKQATCLSQLRLCSHLNHHATDSRPDSPVRQSGPLSGSSSVTPQSPSSRGSGPYWARWKPGRKSRPAETKVVATQSNAEARVPEDRSSDNRRVLKTSFEFDRPGTVTSATVGSPSLAQSASVISSIDSFRSTISNSGKLQKMMSSASASISHSAELSGNGVNLSPTTFPNAETTTAISVKEIISQLTPTQSKPGDVVLNNFDNGTSRNEAIESVPDGGQNFSGDTESLPRVSISDEITAARETVRPIRPVSPDSPLQANPPSSPARTISPARTGASPAGFHKRTDDGRARARGMVKEVGSKDSRFMKDLAKELERAKGSSVSMRSIATKRIPSIKNRSSSIGVRSMTSSVSRSPPRISSMLWEDPPRTPKKDDIFVNRDERPLTAGRSNLDWEKTLQEAASFSLPPPDFGQILQECGQCGRTFKPDSLKVHMRGCRALRRSKEFHTFNGSTVSLRVQQ